MLQVGSKVRVKENAFGDSSHPQDIAARGKTGEVVYIGRDGQVEVKTEDDYLLLTQDEVEAISNGEAE